MSIASEMGLLTTFEQLMEFALRYDGSADFREGAVAEARRKCLEAGLSKEVVVGIEDRLVESICYKKTA